MQSMTMPYHWFVERYFRDLKPIRGFGLWQVWSANQSYVPLLLVVNEIEEIVIKCQYESVDERLEDIELLQRIPPPGEADTGVLAALKPVLPVLSAGNVRPLPKPDTGVGPSMP